jgi:kynurenine formamidase
MLYDLSHIINSGTPVYPGDIKVAINNHANLEHDGYVSYTINSGLHVGTHIDAPMHMIENCNPIHTFPLDDFCGKACVFDVCGQDIISLTDTMKSLIKQYDIVLFYTGFDQFYGQPVIYFANHPVITMELAKFLVSQKVKLVGFDMPSSDKPPFEIHKYLLKNNIFIVENLTNLEPLLLLNAFEFYAIPLKIEAEGSFVRAFAKV